MKQIKKKVKKKQANKQQQQQQQQEVMNRGNKYTTVTQMIHMKKKRKR